MNTYFNPKKWSFPKTNQVVFCAGDCFTTLIKVQNSHVIVRETFVSEIYFESRTFIIANLTKLPYLTSWGWGKLWITVVLINMMHTMHEQAKYQNRQSIKPTCILTRKKTIMSLIKCTRMFLSFIHASTHWWFVTSLTIDDINMTSQSR